MSRLNSGLLSSDRGDWATPQAFFDMVDDEFGFTLDAAADEHNAKCARFYSETDCGLLNDWTGVVWCNPPYGRGIADWVRKGYEAAVNGATVVMLIPARTDTAYWHDYVMRAAEIRLLRGRLVFGSGEARANAPFPSALVVFRPGKNTPITRSMSRGALTRRASSSGLPFTHTTKEDDPHDRGRANSGALSAERDARSRDGGDPVLCGEVGASDGRAAGHHRRSHRIGANESLTGLTAGGQR